MTKQESIRKQTGTRYTYEGDWLALFDDAGIPAGTFNERMIMWVNQELGTDYKNINSAQAAYAEYTGSTTFEAIGDFTPVVTGGAPVVADTTLTWGRLTLAGAGATGLVSTGPAITGSTTNTLAGTNNDHWAIDATGVITPTAAFVASPQASYTLTATVYNASGSDTATVTINTTANAYSFASSAELTAILAISAATLSGKTAYGRTCTLTGFNAATSGFTNRAFTSLFTITKHVGATVTFDRVYFTNVDNLKFLSVNFIATPGDTVSIVSWRGPCDGVIFDGCDLGGTEVINPNADYSAGYYSNFLAFKFTNSGGYPVNATITNCTIHDCDEACVPIVTDALTFTNNVCYSLYGEGIKISHPSNPASTVTIKDNRFYHVFGKNSDSGAPHCDAIQLIGSRSQDWTGITIQGNRIWTGSGARGSWHGVFMDDLPVGYYFTASVINNFFEGDTLHGIHISRAKDCIIKNNTCVGEPGSGNTISIIIGDLATSGTHTVDDNAAEAITVSGSSSNLNNKVLGKQGATIAYSAAFDNSPSGAPDTLTQIMTKYNMKAAGPLDDTVNAGAIGTGYYDWDTGTYTDPRP